MAKVTFIPKSSSELGYKIKYGYMSSNRSVRDKALIIKDCDRVDITKLNEDFRNQDIRAIFCDGRATTEKLREIMEVIKFNDSGRELVLFHLDGNEESVMGLIKFLPSLVKINILNIHGISDSSLYKSMLEWACGQKYLTNFEVFYEDSNGHTPSRFLSEREVLDVFLKMLANSPALKSLYVSCSPQQPYEYFNLIVQAICGNYILDKVCMGSEVDDYVSGHLRANCALDEAFTSIELIGGVET